VLFLVLNAVLFIRPADLIAEIGDWPLYEVLILATLALSLPAIRQQFGARDKALKPINVCFFGLFLAVWCSQLARFHFGDAWAGGSQFAKIVVYFVLLVSLVNTYNRLRVFLLCLVLYIVVLVALAVLQYHGKIDLQALQVLEERKYDEESGELIPIRRLVSTGLYNDPNDLCLILVVGMAFSLYWLEERRVGPIRFAALAPLVLFAYALTLTKSRGGFLALLAGLVALLTARFGWRKTVPLLAVVLPLMVYLFAGRQTDLDLNDTEGSGQARIQLWREGFELFKTAPIFGIGKGEYAEGATQVAHNSFVHCYTELGFFGGTCFTGLMAMGMWSLRRRRPLLAIALLPPELHARAYLLAAMVGYAVGMYSLSRAYIAPTYLAVGLAAAYGELPGVGGHLSFLSFTPRLVVVLFFLSLGTLGMIYLMVRLVPLG
jgi:hypothetical protein